MLQMPEQMHVESNSFTKVELRSKWRISKMQTKVLAAALGALSFSTFASSSAWASSRVGSEICISNGYSCQSWGYRGADPYGYYHFSSTGSNGTKHNCTSYAAYMLGMFSPYDSRWGSLGDATTWASRAKNYGLPVGKIPHVGDIAQWNFGHVGSVEDVILGSNGAVISILVTDDNYNRDVTTQKILYPGDTNSSVPYPDNFITFPALTGGGGGKPAQPLSTDVPTE
jgi:surface antigen